MEGQATQSPSCSMSSKDSIKENLIKHRDSILDCLNPSQICTLIQQFSLADHELFINGKFTTRRKRATLLYEEVLKRSAYSEFLSNLEEDTEHMGHWYIVSLLRGTHFATDEETQESEKLLEMINNNMQTVLREVDVKELESHLIEKKLVTDEDIDELRSPLHTKKDKVRILLVILKTKGPKAHLLFVNKCLAVDPVHYDIYSLLKRTKRKLSDPGMIPLSVKARKCETCFLEPLEGTTTEKYVRIISQIRSYHQSGDQGSYRVAEEIVTKELSSFETPLEVKIALILESCSPFIKDNQLKEVLARVERSREMCNNLYSQGSNAQVLEGRCEWVLARMHKFKGEHVKAEAHINTAFNFIAHCEPGEERMLISFEHACILLQSERKTPGVLQKATNSLLFANSLAEIQDYGTNMVQQCKIHLAQTHHLHISSSKEKNEETVLIQSECTESQAINTVTIE